MTASTNDYKVDLEAPIAVKSQRMASRTSGGMGRSYGRPPLVRAHMRQEAGALILGSLDARSRGCSEGGDDGGKSLAHSLDSGLGGAGKVCHDGFISAVSRV